MKLLIRATVLSAARVQVTTAKKKHLMANKLKS